MILPSQVNQNVTSNPETPEKQSFELEKSAIENAKTKRSDSEKSEIENAKTKRSDSEKSEIENLPELRLMSECQIRTKPIGQIETEFMSTELWKMDLPLTIVDPFWMKVDLSSLQNSFVRTGCLKKSLRDSVFRCQIYSADQLSSKTHFFIKRAQIKILKRGPMWTQIQPRYIEGYMGARCFGYPLMKSNEFFENLSRICNSTQKEKPQICSRINASLLAMRVGQSKEEESAETSKNAALAKDHSSSSNESIVAEQEARNKKQSMNEEVPGSLPKKTLSPLRPVASMDLWLLEGHWKFSQSGSSIVEFSRFSDIGYGLEGHFNFVGDRKLTLGLARIQVRVVDIPATFNRSKLFSNFEQPIPALSQRALLITELGAEEQPILLSGTCSTSCATYSNLAFGLGVGYLLPETQVQGFRVANQISFQIRAPFWVAQSVTLTRGFGTKLQWEAGLSKGGRWSIPIRFSYESDDRTLDITSTGGTSHVLQTIYLASLGLRWNF